ncbi:MAG: AAA family ATPase [Phycisphaerae bacterium]|nr:AAA family ATPase [Phycisphaerae bacterium]
MKARNICAHNIDDGGIESLSDFKVVSKTRSRQDLRQTIGNLPIGVLVIDLDVGDALDTVVEALEIDPDIAVVGVTGRTEPKLMIAALRAGCRQLTTKPLDTNDLNIALRRALNEAVRPNARSLTVATIGAVGGAGSTTLACYLAAGFAEVGRERAAIIDVDLDFGNVARSWDLNPPHTIGSVASAGAVDPAIVEKVACEVKGGVHVIARPRTIEEAHAIDEPVMTRIIQNAKLVFPYVVLDLPRKLDAVTGCAIELADKLLIVLQLSVPAVNNAKRLVEALSRLGMHHERMELVVNRCRKNIHNLSIDLIEKEFKRPVCGVIPNDFRSIATANDLGQPVSMRSPVRSSIREIASRLANRGEQATPKMGWLSKLGLRRHSASGVTQHVP